MGFRFTARQIARRFGACGWVMNMPDGSVSAVIESSQSVLSSVLQELKGVFRNNITDIEIVEGPVEGSSGFEVRY